MIEPARPKIDHRDKRDSKGPTENQMPLFDAA